MNSKIINVIIKREYLNRVKKKSFLIITFLGPILFAALCILPSLIMLNTKEESKVIAVVDRSGIVQPYLTDTETISYVDHSSEDAEALKADMKNLGIDAVLAISELDTVALTVKADAYSPKPLGVDMTDGIQRRINDAVEAYRISSYDIDNLETIMKDVKSNVRLTSYTMDESGKETISESGVYMLVSMLLGSIIYLFIALFGGQVMSSVIEEKASRVVEVLVSSVKSTELMFGKIIGVALVALTQFFLWIVLTLIIVAAAGGIMGVNMLGSDDPAAIAQTMGVSQEQMEMVGSMTGMDAMMAASDTTAVASEPSGMDAVVSTIKHLPMAQILVSFLLFFVFGYLLYASLFAAIGSAVENEADTQQLQIPLTIPLLLGFFIALYAYKAPDSALVFWGSMIPFTSPIVMLARVPFGVPVWELIVSIVVLILSFVACAYISAKIYKVGILMYGKKSTFKDLWKWLKQK